MAAPDFTPPASTSRLAKLSRRKFVKFACAASAGSALIPRAGQSAISTPETAPSPRRSDIKFGFDVHLGPGSPWAERLLEFARQLGVEWVATPLRATQGEPMEAQFVRPAIPIGDRVVGGSLGGGLGGPNGPWTERDLQTVIARAKAKGMRVGNVGLHAMPHAILGTSERDRDIEHVQQSIRLAGRVGIPVVQYSFLALPPLEGLYVKPGRGGSVYRAFDNSRVPDQAPVAGVGTASDAVMWERLKYFLRAVVPVAEEAGVKLALHPDDPPVPSYRGIAQPCDTIEHWKRLVNFMPSPANGIVLETGVTTELGGDVVEMIHYFGARNCIHHVHFRNARAIKPAVAYDETFIDEGQADMLAAMRALHEVGYQGMLVPDHSPVVAGDNDGHFGAWGFALGYIKGLMKAAS